uniref:Uncharacterized protein n=1 Tax=Meloidogyne enterolobii TaxID=390850 RepID=A0A6V7WDK9_MELEN|nr:unnamed protein product [Meloidogyne enterolobii]
MDGSATPATTVGGTQAKIGGNPGTISAVIYICGDCHKENEIRPKIQLDVENVAIEFFTRKELEK